MKKIWIFILFIAFGCQQSTVNSQQTSCFMSTDNSQQTTDFLESENLKTSESEKSCEPRAMSKEPFSKTEKSVNISEICGNEKTNHKLVQKKSEKVCEPRAMSNETFFESENLKTSESEESCEPRAMSNEQRFRKAQSSQLEAQSTSQVFRGVGMVRARFYIGFTNLVYNMCRLVQIKRYHPDWIIN